MRARLRHGREVLRRSDGVRAESQRALDGLKGEFEALTRELTAEGGAAAASWSAASSGLPHGARLPVVSAPWLVSPVPVLPSDGPCMPSDVCLTGARRAAHVFLTTRTTVLFTQLAQAEHPSVCSCLLWGGAYYSSLHVCSSAQVLSMFFYFQARIGPQSHPLLARARAGGDGAGAQGGAPAGASPHDRVACVLERCASPTLHLHFASNPDTPIPRNRVQAHRAGAARGHA